MDSFASHNICNIAFFRQTALRTLRALKVLAKKALFLSHLCKQKSSNKKAHLKKPCTSHILTGLTTPV